MPKRDLNKEDLNKNNVNEKNLSAKDLSEMDSSDNDLPGKVDAKRFQEKLLNWYHKNKRKMAWRDDPTPYHVWISEIMLQQTRVEAVHGYYERFMRRLPDIKSLAQVEDDELHKLWEGLGYYNRAKNLKKAAQILMSEYEGELPSTYEELLKLPGIGPYTAGAISSIAFHQSVPAVDGNVMRVIARLSGDYRDIMQNTTRKAMEEIVKELILPEEVHHFNQALMELGALICIPNGMPKCEECPVRELCYAHETNSQSELPVKAPKKSRKIEKRTIFVFVNERREFLIQKRPSKGLLSGLWEFISIEGHHVKGDLERYLEDRGISFESIHQIENSKHIFTHIEWRMQGYLVIVNGRFPTSENIEIQKQIPMVAENRQIHTDIPEMVILEEHCWCDFEDLKEKYSIPAAFKTYFNSIEKGEVQNLLSSPKSCT